MGFMRVIGVGRWKRWSWNMIDVDRVGTRDVPTLLERPEP